PLQRRHLDHDLRFPAHHRPAGDDRDWWVGHLRRAHSRCRPGDRPRSVSGCARLLPDPAARPDPGGDRGLRAARPLAHDPQCLRQVPCPGGNPTTAGSPAGRPTRGGSELTTGLVWHELYMWHDTGTGAWVIPAGLTVQPLGHLENAEGKRRIRNLLEVSGLIEHLVLLKPR